MTHVMACYYKMRATSHIADPAIYANEYNDDVT